MKLLELKNLLENINDVRPFTAYIHGTNKKDFVNGLIDNQIDLNIYYGRNNIFSTFANLGTAKTDITDRIFRYSYAGNFNVVMVVPDEIKTTKYCGCVLGQEETTTGYTNYTEVDYQVMAFNDYIKNKKLLNKDNCGICNFKCNKVNNKLILGYFNKMTNEFLLNKNCILFENEDEYKNICKNTKKNVDLMYFYHIKIELIKQSLRRTEEERKAISNIVHDEQSFKDFIEWANTNYILSDEFKFDFDIENYKTRNRVDFKSNISLSLDEYLELYYKEKELL